jgi:lipid II:glycine glycyltransferase (peptidoglycan interpeptide bridge formation enzyme)
VYSALSERYAQQKIRLPLKAQYLRDLYQSFGQTGLRTFLALYDGKVVGSIICVAYKDTFVSWQGGSRPGDNGFESNELLFWHTIEKAIQEGFKWFEIEGANSQHLCDFKSRFNPSISPYFMVRRADLIGQLAEKAYFTIFKPV